MKALTREKGSGGRYMLDGTVVQTDCIVKMHADVIGAGRNESHDRSEPGRGAGCALGNAEPFVESVEGAEGSQGD